MASLDDEWEAFMCNGQSHDFRAKAPTKPIINDENDDDDEEPTRKSSELYISTKTKKPFLNTTEKIDIYSLFWKIPIIEYWIPQEGVIKKQMKVVCNTEEETEILENHKKTAYYVKDRKITKQTENTNRKRKYKDERKISVGLCSKDVLNCRSKEGGGAMYNCIAITLRFRNASMRFIEVHIKIFNTGKLEIPGVIDMDLYERIKIFLLGILAPHFLPHVLEYLPPTSDNVIINSNFYVGFNVDRDILHNILRSDKYKMDTIYDACTYPAVKSRFYFYNDYGFDKEKQRGIVREEDNGMKTAEILKSDKYTKVSFMVFRTGSCLIVGNCTEEILYFVYEFVKDMLHVEKQHIYVDGEEITESTKTQATKLRKRKIAVSAPYFSAIKRVED
jgi:hypothetical protein